MQHLSSGKSCSDAEPANPRRFLRVAGALRLVALDSGISVHLLANHVPYWWLPLVVLLVIGHGVIIGGIAWMVMRHRRNPHDVSAKRAGSCEGHEHSVQNHVLRNPRVYDCNAWGLTLSGERKFRRRTLDLAQLHSGDTVLDVGCGTGTLLIEAAKRVGPSGSTYGIDRSTEMVAHARRKAAAQGVTAHFVEGSADRLAFSDASFDVVFCTLMLHHLPALMQAVSICEMRRVLRPGGRIVIVDMQQVRPISAAFSLVALFHIFHQFGSRATMPDWQKIEELLTQQGVQLVSRGAIWGETVRSLVGRIASPPTPRSATTNHPPVASARR